jgi:hypothetical protein
MAWSVVLLLQRIRLQTIRSRVYGYEAAILFDVLVMTLDPRMEPSLSTEPDLSAGAATQANGPVLVASWLISALRFPGVPCIALRGPAILTPPPPKVNYPELDR